MAKISTRRKEPLRYLVLRYAARLSWFKLMFITGALSLLFMMFRITSEHRLNWTEVRTKQPQLAGSVQEEMGPPFSGPPVGGGIEVEDPHREIPHVDLEAQPEALRKLPWFNCVKYICEKTKGLSHLHLQEGPVTSSAKNVTPLGSSLLIYNRVNKCGSSTTQHVLKSLGKKLRYHHSSSLIHFPRVMNRTQQENLIRSITKRKGSRIDSFDRHMYYFNVTRYDLDRPIWFNIIRNPVSRYISHFYYTRNPIIWKTLSYLRKMSHPPKSWFEKDINTCLLEDDPECSLSPGKMREMMITFFCGQHPACMEIGNVGALQRAKRHVENYYSVVGIMEEFELSFKVLEGYVPRFFKGAAEVFRRNDTEMHYNKGNVKYNITEETKERLRQMLALDIEFYEFVKQRLRLQAQNLDLV